TIEYELSLHPVGVVSDGRSTPTILVYIKAPTNADRIGHRPAPQPRRIVPRRVVAESRLFVALHACVAVALRRYLELAVDQPICARAVGVVLLVRDDRPGLGHLRGRRTEVVAQLETPDSRGGPDDLALVDRAGLNEHDSAPVVADVQRLPLFLQRAVDPLA